MLARAAARFQHVARHAVEEPSQHRPDRLMVAVKRRRIEPAVGLNLTAIPAKFEPIIRHRRLRLGSAYRRCTAF
jgi:hypothetical protein